MQRVILGLVLLTTGTLCFSQSLNSYQVDTATYGQFMRSSWNELIQTGKRAFKSGIDFYYLRLRVGAAEYNKKNYAGSIRHFKKAVKQNPEDTIAREYLFYASLFLNRKNAASLCYQELTPARKKVTGMKFPALIRSVNLDYTYGGLLNDQSREDLHQANLMPSYDPGSVVSQYSVLTFNLEHELGTRMRLFHGYSRLQKFQDRISRFYSDYYLIRNEKIMQDQYYLALSITPGYGWTITPAVHLVRSSWPAYTETIRMGNLFLGETGTQKDFSFIAGLGINYNISKISLLWFPAYSEIGGIRQVENEMQLLYYPLGNLNFYLGSVFKSIFELNNQKEDRYNGYIMLGFKPAGNIWIENQYHLGKIRYQTLNYGYFFYNDPNPIDRLYTLKLIYSPGNRGNRFFVNYRYARLGANFILGTDPLNATDINIPYELHTITGGIKWNISGN